MFFVYHKHYLCCTVLCCARIYDIFSGFCCFFLSAFIFHSFSHWRNINKNKWFLLLFLFYYNIIIIFIVVIVNCSCFFIYIYTWHYFFISRADFICAAYKCTHISIISFIHYTFIHCTFIHCIVIHYFIFLFFTFFVTWTCSYIFSVFRRFNAVGCISFIYCISYFVVNEGNFIYHGPKRWLICKCRQKSEIKKEEEKQIVWNIYWLSNSKSENFKNFFKCSALWLIFEQLSCL